MNNAVDDGDEDATETLSEHSDEEAPEKGLQEPRHDTAGTPDQQTEGL